MAVLGESLTDFPGNIITDPKDEIGFFQPFCDHFMVELGQPLAAHVQRYFYARVQRPDDWHKLRIILDMDDISFLAAEIQGSLQAVFQVIKVGSEKRAL
jgi:hypothetical protein